MREDMAKVLVERPRVGGHAVKKTKPNIRDIESLPLREKTSRNAPLRGYSGKQLSDHIAPLRRWLHAQVGRPWDKVYSEIRKVCGADNTIEAHIYGHIWGYVDRYAVLVDGVCKKRNTYGAGGFSAYTTWDLFVHPVTGLLCRGTEKPRQWRKVDRGLWREVKGTKGMRVLAFYNERWMHCRLRPLPTTKHDVYVPLSPALGPTPQRYDSAVDALTGATVSRDLHHQAVSKPDENGRQLWLRSYYGHDDRYAYLVRPATSKEIDRWV